MRWIVPLLLVAGALAMPVGAQAPPPVTYGFGGADLDVALLVNQGTPAQPDWKPNTAMISFEIEEAAFGFQPHSVLVRLDCTCGEILITAHEAADGTWVATLPIDTPDLVVGTWTVAAQASSESGQTASKTGTGKVQVTAAPDTTAPTLSVAGLQSGKLKLGAGQSLQVSVEDALLRKVTYQIQGQPQPFTLPFPYRLGVASFSSGAQDIEIVAHDRAGRTTKSSFQVYADAAAPTFLLSEPEVLYQGIPNPIELKVLEHSKYTVIAEINGSSASKQFTGSPQVQAVQIDVVPPREGVHPVRIRVVDELLNEATLTHNVQVDRVITDVALASVKQVETPISGAPLRAEITAQQVEGVTQLTFDVVFKGQVVANLTLPKNGSSTQTVDILLPPGKHQGVLTLQAPAHVVELNPANQSLAATLEVYLAQVRHGEDLYHIRGTALGLPDVAVGKGGTYPLALRTIDGRSVYGFEANGTSLYWDPATSTTDIPLPESVSGDDKGIPHVALVSLLGLLAALAAIRRR